MCWSHILSAMQGSGCVIETITRAVVARFHCCANKNSADKTALVYTDTSSSMEGFAADKYFAALKDKLTILNACFDGDASTPQHLISHHPDARATRDPNHIAKNVYKQLMAIYHQLKYSCSCPRVKNKNGSLSKTRVCNKITKAKAKSAQVWVGKILRETKKQETAKKLLCNFLNHLEGKCKEGEGCQHSFHNYVHTGHINCPEMMSRFRQYFETNVIDIVHKIIIEDVGAIHTNTNESVNKVCKQMRDKNRVLGAALYRIRTDIAYLMQNQKAITRYQPGSRRHYLAEILQRCGHEVTAKQVSTWINEQEQGLIKDERNRTDEQKKKNIKRKYNRFKKSCANAKDSQDYYKSGGKQTNTVIDLLDDSDNDEAEDMSTVNYPATDEVLNTFTPKGLKTLAIKLITNIGEEVQERTRNIPTAGRGQKKAWFQLLQTLIREQNLNTLTVPIDICRTEHRLINAKDANSEEIMVLHPQLFEIRLQFDDNWSLLVFFDLETTGLGIHQAQMLQIAMLACLSRPNEPLEYIGTYNTYIECKMRFPEDTTARTGIKIWHRSDSQLRGAPPLPVVNAQIKKKIIEWKRTVDAKYKRRVYSQFVSWNGDSFKIPLWVLQTDEMQGEGAWAKLFLNCPTGLVAQTDLNRIRPHCGFVPKTKKDIEDYFNKETKKKTDDTCLRAFNTKEEALHAYAQHHFPGIGKQDIETIIQEPEDFEHCVERMYELGAAHLKQQKKTATAIKKKASGVARANKRKKARKWTTPANLRAFHKWMLGRSIPEYHGAPAIKNIHALKDIYIGKLRAGAEKFNNATKNTLNKYVSRSLVQKYKDIVNKAKEKSRANNGIGRKPYGKGCGVCIGHQYPVSLIKWKRIGSANNGRICEVCNWEFNSKREGGERRRCGHQKFL